MKEEKIISGSTEDQVWQQIEADFKKDPSPFEYYAQINQNGKKVYLEMDIDPGGGFESGFATTTFKAPVQIDNDYKFALHEESFLDEVGKFFGMQDVELGYEEFDKKLIVKTNAAEKTKVIFSNAAVRKIVQSLKSFTLSITSHKNDSGDPIPYLELTIEDGITDTNRLRQLYTAFFSILNALDRSS